MATIIPRIVGRCTPAITSVGCMELPQIHLAYCIHNEPGQVTLAQPIPHGRRHQVALVSLAAQKVISHSIVTASCFYQLTASPTLREEGLWDTLLYFRLVSHVFGSSHLRWRQMAWYPSPSRTNRDSTTTTTAQSMPLCSNAGLIQY